MKTLRNWGVHLTRVAMLAAIFVVMHWTHSQMLNASRMQSVNQIDFNSITKVFPKAVKWGDAKAGPTGYGGLQVLDTQGDPLGYVIQTSPDSDRFLGFSGPTNLFIAFDNDNRIIGIDLLSSRDTRDHVELIHRDGKFFPAWIGLSWSEAANRKDIDGVSGATLTSMAMAQGIQRRLGATNVAPKFSKPLVLADVAKLFPNAAAFNQDKSTDFLWHIFDDKKQPLGSILRTSPAADEVIGYQGPTETRIAIALDGSIAGIAIADSFDNEPYVGYVRGDYGFEPLIKQYTLDQWSQMDLQKEQIEGVSGATMTSMAVARGIIETARELESQRNEKRARQERWQAGIYRSIGTLIVIALGLAVGLSSLRGRPVIRVGFQIILLVYLGLINGDLLSLAMFQGWAQSGIPWQNAFGLVVLAIAAFVIPIAARTNIYCSHLCPHGALQQLLPRRWKMKQPIPKQLAKCLVWIRPLLLAWVVLVTFLQLPFSIVDIEPFDAYAWRAAAWPTIAVAIVGIVASFKVPMAYCRYGCATGALLDYVRRHSRSDRLTRADLFAFCCLMFGVAIYFFSNR
ncbi:MAG: FMN-binding protein [Planctomycetota bacterium]|nr:FMN-binding protein [Planctomycetota bacterium]